MNINSYLCINKHIIMGIIYCYTNKINGKSYVGQTRYPKRRRYQHSHEVINGNKSKKPFYNAVLKYGIDNFNYTVLEETDNDNLNSREIYWIKKLDSFGKNGYNMTAGGEGMNGYKAPLKTFICDYCGKEYKSAESPYGNRWCSDKCQYEYDRETGRRDKESKCIICGKIFTRYKNLRSNVCSLQCATERDSKMFTCEYCGKEYKAKDTGNNKYCSKNCQVKSRYHTGKGREIRKCVYCGNEFSALKHRKQETCSRTCSNYLMWQRRKKNEQGE